jgi:A/G-specific adenine glycosylase
MEPDGSPSASLPPLPDANWRRAFRRRLGRWYDQHARDLPWRRSADPYPIWLSEIMLQQTQVATVKAYFERFMRAFPSLEALARADRQDVLRLWEGLGYYRRATQLHRAAQTVVREHGGVFPREPDSLCRLPGIGRYTAGAILSIAFDLRLPILEANTTRLWSRLLAYRGDPTSAAGQRLLWAMAEAVLPRRGVGRFNQALMELGGQVCSSPAPPCDVCPVAPLCRANRQGLQGRIPPAKSKRPPESVREAAVLVRRRGRVLLVQCGENGRWAGLWDFPRFPLHAEHPAALRRELIHNVRRLAGVDIAPGRHLKTIKHGVTRFRITLDCYDAQYAGDADARPAATNLKWLRPGQLDGYPLSTTGRELARLIGREPSRRGGTRPPRKKA